MTSNICLRCSEFTSFVDEDWLCSDCAERKKRCEALCAMYLVIRHFAREAWGYKARVCMLQLEEANIHSVRDIEQWYS